MEMAGKTDAYSERYSSERKRSAGVGLVDRSFGRGHSRFRSQWQRDSLINCREKQPFGWVGLLLMIRERSRITRLVAYGSGRKPSSTTFYALSELRDGTTEARALFRESSARV
jgi:hypothetical protein